jgi:hypothetical protein
MDRRQLTEACGWGEPPRYIIRDRHGAYGEAFIRRLGAMGKRDRPISARSRTTECGFGRRLLGHTCLWQGDFIEAPANLVEALSIYDPERDREATFRFGPDTAAAARILLAAAFQQHADHRRRFARRCQT